MSLFNKMHHVSLRCVGEEKMNEAIQFYTELIGLKLIRKWGSGKDAGCMLDAGNAIVEIFADAESERTIGPVDHFAFEVDDVDHCIKTLREAGYEITKEPADMTVPAEPEPFSLRMGFCNGPLGESIEFYHEI